VEPQHALGAPNHEEALLTKRLIALGAVLSFFLVVAMWQSCCGGKAVNMTGCLPTTLAAWLPQHFLHIRDVDHLMLVILFFAGLANISISIYYLYTQQGSVGEVVGLVMLSPCVIYIHSCVRSYDDRLCTRKEEVEKRREEIGDMYQNMMEESEARLHKANESNAGLAEQHFSSRKRDFQRFLEWVSNLEFAGTAGEQPPEEQLLERFIRQWLRVFEETSVDLERKPRVGDRVAFAAMFDNASGVAANARNLREALLREEVEFIKVERDKLLKKKQKHAIRKAKSVMRRCVKPIKCAKNRACDACPSWCSCCAFAGFGCERLETTIASDVESIFPVQISLGCCSFIVVNQGHITVMLGLLFAPILIVYYILDGERRRRTDPEFTHVGIQASLLIFMLCLLIVLWHFERIDALMSLEQEIAELEGEREDLISQRVRIADFFGKSQALVDFWTTRTLPLLDLMKEFHEAIEDRSRAQKRLDAAVLLRICDLVDEVNSRIGTPAAWRRAMDGDWSEVGETRKETITQFVRGQMKAGDLPQLLDGMQARMPALSCDFLVDIRPHEGGSSGSSTRLGLDPGRPKTLSANLREKTHRSHPPHSDPAAKSHMVAARP